MRHSYKKRSYKNAETIARETMTRDKIGITEARTLIDEYWRLKTELDKKNAIIEAMYGGEKVTESMGRHKDWDIMPPVARDGNRVHSRNLRIPDIMRELKSLGDINVDIPAASSWVFIEGNEKKVRSFLDACAIITDALQLAYLAGEEHGHRLLLRLAQGEKTIHDYNAVAKEENHV